MSTEPDSLEVWTALEAAKEVPIYGPFLPPPPPEHPVEVRWYCGYFLQGGGWFEDPPECEASWESTEEQENWAEGLCSSYCPHCGALCYQSDGHAEVVVDKAP